MNLYDILNNIYDVLKILFKKIFNYNEKYNEMISSIEKLKDEEKKLKKSVLSLKRKKSIEESKLIPFSFSVLVAAAVGNLLNTLSTSIDIFENHIWVSVTTITIILTITFIGYIFEKFPNDRKTLLKTAMVGFGSITTFSLIRFYHFFNLYLNEGSEFENLLTVNYFISMAFIALIGIGLIIHAFIEKDAKKRYLLEFAGGAILLNALIFMSIMKPDFGG